MRATTTVSVIMKKVAIVANIGTRRSSSLAMVLRSGAFQALERGRQGNRRGLQESAVRAGRQVGPGYIPELGEQLAGPRLSCIIRDPWHSGNETGQICQHPTGKRK